MKTVNELNDDELKAELSSFGFSAGPITGTTRSILQKKLEAFRSGSGTLTKAKTKKQQKAVEPSSLTPAASRAQENLTNVSLPHSDPNLSFGLNDSGASSNAFKTFNNTSLNTAIKNRTPTPPRAQTIGKRTPIRQQVLSSGGEGTSTSSSTSPRSNEVPNTGLFGRTSIPGSAGSIRYSRSSFGTGLGDAASSDRSYKRFSTGTTAFANEFGQENDDDEEEDDHMESSRILSPKSRFRPSFGTNAYGRGPQKPSPVEKFKQFGKSAWGFFSRPIGTSTPCSDSGYSYGGYASSKYKPRPRFVDSNAHQFLDAKKGSPDFSRWIPRAVIAFFVVLFCTYVSRAHPEVVYNSLSATGDFVVATFHFLYNYAIMPTVIIFIIGLVVLGLYKLYSYYNSQKEAEKNKLMLLVERITDIIYDSGSSGVAEPHVRDMIMPPTKRSGTDYKRWQEAARFINNEDSRIRTEIRLINGTECNVWIWIGAGKQRWQGTAVAEGSPMARVPEQALTRCLKLRGINFSSNPIERNNIRKELLSKLYPTMPVHVGFISGAENVVYIMLKDLADAKKAFVTFHSHWFNGNLLTAKYVRDQRYLERFPDAENAL